MPSSVMNPLTGAAAAITDASAGGFSGVSATAVTSAAAYAPPPAAAEAGARCGSHSRKGYLRSFSQCTPISPCCSKCQPVAARRIENGTDMMIGWNWCQMRKGCQLQPSGQHLYRSRN